MNNVNLLKKYAVTYVSKYESTKKNLEKILKNKIRIMKSIEKKEKFDLYNYIPKIIEELESKKIINDKNFSEMKIRYLFSQGKSEYFIKSILIKKGVETSLINDSLEKFTKDNPDWKIQSAKFYANKKRLGKFGNLNNKKKDLSKMARAGFAYDIIKKVIY